MRFVWLMMNEQNEVVAIYDDATLAQTMLPALEEKFKTKVTVVRRSVNQDIKMIGIVK